MATRAARKTGDENISRSRNNYNNSNRTAAEAAATTLATKSAEKGQ